MCIRDRRWITWATIYADWNEEKSVVSNSGELIPCSSPTYQIQVSTSRFSHPLAVHLHLTFSFVLGRCFLFGFRQSCVKYHQFTGYSMKRNRQYICQHQGIMKIALCGDTIFRDVSCVLLLYHMVARLLPLMLPKSPFYASSLTESIAPTSGIYAQFMLAVSKYICSIYARNA